MPSLKSQDCEPISDMAVPLTMIDIECMKPEIPNWEVVEEEVGGLRLRQTFEFPDLIEAAEFITALSELSEQQAHHPVILTGPQTVTVTWCTDSLNGLHKNDFVMAAKTDQLYKKWLGLDEQRAAPKDEVQVASEQSFPASDPPAFSSGRA